MLLLLLPAVAAAAGLTDASLTVTTAAAHALTCLLIGTVLDLLRKLLTVLML